MISGMTGGGAFGITWECWMVVGAGTVMGCKGWFETCRVMD